MKRIALYLALATFTLNLTAQEEVYLGAVEVLILFLYTLEWIFSL